MICGGTLTYEWVDRWVDGWGHVESLKTNKSWHNWDNSILFAEFWSVEILPCTHYPLESVINNWNYEHHHSPIVWLFDNWHIMHNCQFGHSFDMLTFDFLLKPPQPVTVLSLDVEFIHRFLQPWVFWILSRGRMVPASDRKSLGFVNSCKALVLILQTQLLQTVADPMFPVRGH